MGILVAIEEHQVGELIGSESRGVDINERRNVIGGDGKKGHRNRRGAVWIKWGAHIEGYLDATGQLEGNAKEEGKRSLMYTKEP